MFVPQDISDLVKQVGDLLLTHNCTLAVSEGACGGLLSAYLISIPGASAFFDGGRLIYSLRSRLRLSGWNSEDIRSYTGPSEQVAVKFARNLRIEFGSSYVLSETGFAGPGNTLNGIATNNDTASLDAEVAVGTVYLGIAGPKGDRSNTVVTGVTDRAENMEMFAKHCLQFLLATLEHDFAV